MDASGKHPKLFRKWSPKCGPKVPQDGQHSVQFDTAAELDSFEKHPKLTPEWLPKWRQNGRKKGAQMAPKWLPNGPKKGSRGGPGGKFEICQFSPPLPDRLGPGLGGPGGAWGGGLGVNFLVLEGSVSGLVSGIGSGALLGAILAPSWAPKRGQEGPARKPETSSKGKGRKC